MEEHSWKPIAFDDDGYTIEVIYRNEQGEEYLHVSDSYGTSFSCWEGCSGEWPACKWDYPIYNRHRSKSILEDYIRRENNPDYNPFDSLQHHECFIDDNNLYVEQFETLDGAQWEIAVDVGEQLLDMLDDETRDGG